MLWALLLFVISPPLCVLAYWLNRDHEDEPAEWIEVILRAAIAGTILAVFLVVTYLIVDRFMDRSQLEFYVAVGAVVVPIGGWLMMFIMSLNDIGKGLLAFLTYLVIPACMALLFLRGG